MSNSKCLAMLSNVIEEFWDEGSMSYMYSTKHLDEPKSITEAIREFFEKHKVKFDIKESEIYNDDSSSTYLVSYAWISKSGPKVGQVIAYI